MQTLLCARSSSDLKGMFFISLFVMLQKIHNLGKKDGVFSVFHWFYNKSKRTISLSYVMLFL